MHTFFFGYLSLKWRRFTRTLFPIVWLIYLAILEPYYPGDIREMFLDSDYDELILFHLPPLIFFLLLSYVMKPFVDKEN